MRIPSVLSVVTVTLLLAMGGCASSGGKSGRDSAQLREALEIPPDLARPAGEDLTAGVPASRPAAAAAEPTAPPAAAAAAATAAKPAEAATARLERDGAVRWLAINQPPEQAFARVRDYFVRNDLKLVVDNAETRLLETDWIERRVNLGKNVLTRLFASMQSTGLRDKYRVRVEPGKQAGTSDVYVTHQGLEEIVLDSANIGGPATTWQPRPADPAAESEMLDRLLAHYGVDTRQAPTQLADSSGARVQRVKDQLLLPSQDLDSAWRRIGIELDRAGVVIEDRDRTAGIYYVRYTDSGASGQGGLFGWLKSDETLAERNKQATGRYQVAVKQVADGISIGVRDVTGEPDRSERAARLLDRIYAQMR